MKMKDIEKFDAEYDSSHEDAALQARGAFIRRFPIHSLKKLTLEQYVVGHNEPTFCNLVESGTLAWANVRGATAFKFGIYYGRIQSDPQRKYRFAEKFGKNKEVAFAAVKAALLELIALGEKHVPDCSQIDANPLSQMFKAKILSLYYPDKFLAVCSTGHLEMLAHELRFPEGLEASKYQMLLLNFKQANPITRKWSEPKFMAYLYRVYVRSNEHQVDSPLKKPKTKKHRRINFEEIQKQRQEIGRIAEEYAFKWEKERLIGAKLDHLVNKIKDRRTSPGYGYDFLSYDADNKHRFIEVKCVAKRNGGHRFFLSENEHQTSLSKDCCNAYYFYLVFFNRKKQPTEIMAILGQHLYPTANMAASSYEVRFDRKLLD